MKIDTYIPDNIYFGKEEKAMFIEYMKSNNMFSVCNTNVEGRIKIAFINLKGECEPYRLTQDGYIRKTTVDLLKRSVSLIYEIKITKHKNEN